MRKGIRTLSLTMALAMAMGSLTGCGSVTSNDVASYPLVSGLTTQEVIDFYAEALKYDTVIKRNLDVHETNYELKDVSPEKQEQLKNLTLKAQDILSQMDYEYTRSNSAIVPEETFHYIKSYLNSIGLNMTGEMVVKQALGYYFVDVDYNVVPANIGKIKEDAHLLGINGAFERDYVEKIDKVDDVFLEESVHDLNEYYEENKIPKKAYMEGNLVIIEDTEELGSSSNYYEEPSYTPPVDDSVIYDEDGNPITADDLLSTDIPQSGNIENTETESETETTEETVDTEDSLDSTEDSLDSTETTGEIEVETEPEEIVTTTPPVVEQPVATVTNNDNRGDVFIYKPNSDRLCKIDVNEFNSVIGSSAKDKAYMPELSMVYDVPASSADISGVGLYPSGGNGLGIFGMNRENITGNVTLRYVFKEDLLTGTFKGINIYPIRETINTGMTTASDNVHIADFLKSELDMILEKADRATIDTLLKPLISGDIYEDMGFAMLRGYEANYVDLIKQMSTIRQVLSKNTDNNSWLLEIETTRIEGSKAAESYGTFRDKYFVVVQQQGTNMVIIDSLRTSRALVEEPAIEPDSATEKRLVALNLAGEVQESEKAALRDLMSMWYKAGTYRKLTAGEATRKGETVTIERGMEDLFNSDPSMLSTENKNYTLSEVQNLLVKHGAKVNSEYIGTIAEWMGGNDLQVEFTTEELITYDGKGDAVYMQVYYLVSNMNDIWVIDERTILEEEIINGNEIQNIKSRIGN